MNVFFITHLGQLEQVEALVDYENLSNNDLYILYTSANKRVPNLIMERASREKFSNVRLLEIPKSPNKLSIGKLNKIHAIYNKALRSAPYSAVYMLSFEKHYALIGDIAKKMGLKLSLIEEGTATYKFDEFGNNVAPVGSERGFMPVIKRLVINSIPSYKEIRPALGYWKNFDCVYAAFPEKLRSAFDFSKAERFFMHASGREIDEKIFEILKKYKMNERDYIYVNQRYPIENEAFAKNIINILEMQLSFDGENRVFIKFHPKDSESIKSEFAKAILRSKFKNKFLIISEPAFLIEPVVSLVKPAAVIGIASTALVYAPLLSSKTRVVCLGDEFLNRLEKSKKLTSDARGLIESHISIVKKFDGIDILSFSDGRSNKEIIRPGIASPGECNFDESLINSEFWISLLHANKSVDIDLNCENSIFLDSVRHLVNGRYDELESVFNELSNYEFSKPHWLILYARYNYMIGKKNKSKTYYDMFFDIIPDRARNIEMIRLEYILSIGKMSEKDFPLLCSVYDRTDGAIKSRIQVLLLYFSNKIYNEGRFWKFRKFFDEKSNDFIASGGGVKSFFYYLKIKTLVATERYSELSDIWKRKPIRFQVRHLLWLAHGFAFCGQKDNYRKAFAALEEIDPRYSKSALCLIWSDLLNSSFVSEFKEISFDNLTKGIDYSILLRHGASRIEYLRRAGNHKSAVIGMEKIAKFHPLTRIEFYRLHASNGNWTELYRPLKLGLNIFNELPIDVVLSCFYAVLKGYDKNSKNIAFDIKSLPENVKSDIALYLHSREDWGALLEFLDEYSLKINPILFLEAAYKRGQFHRIDDFHDIRDIGIPERVAELKVMSVIYTYMSHYDLASQCYVRLARLESGRRRDSNIFKSVILNSLSRI